MFGTLFGAFGTLGTSGTFGTFLDFRNNVPEHHRLLTEVDLVRHNSARSSTVRPGWQIEVRGLTNRSKRVATRFQEGADEDKGQAMLENG